MSRPVMDRRGLVAGLAISAVLWLVCLAMVLGVSRLVAALY